MSRQELGSMEVSYLREQPASSGLVAACRESQRARSGRMTIEREHGELLVCLYHGTDLLAVSTLDFVYGEQRIEAAKHYEEPYFPLIDWDHFERVREEAYSS